MAESASQAAARRQRQDSYAPLVYDVAYAQYEDAAPTPFPFHDLFQSLSVNVGAGKIWTGTLNLFDKTEQFLTGPQRPGLRSRFDVRWYWGNMTPEQVAAVPTYKAGVLEVTPTFAPEGVGLSISIAGERIVAAGMNKQAGDREWPAQTRFSKIVRDICESQGWSVAAIEDDSNRCADALRMSGESCQEFIMKKVVPQTVNAQHARYSFFLDPDGGVHFHTAAYALPGGGLGADAFTPVRDYVAYADMTGEVESFQPHDNSRFVMLTGGGDAVHAGTDADGGKPVHHVSTIEGGVKDPTKDDPSSANPPMTTDEQHSPNLRTGGGADQAPSAFVGWVARDPSEALDRARGLYAHLKSMQYTADLTVRGTHDIVPLSHLAVRYFVAGATKEHYLSGLFKAREVSHEVGSGGWRTSVTMDRMGTKADPAEKQIKSETGQSLAFTGEGHSH